MPFARLFFFTFLQLALWVSGFALIAPQAFQAEIGRPGMIVLWTFLFGIPLSLFEYLYHRYLLHSAILPFMASMHRSHGQHHSLTSVKAPVRKDEPATLVPVHSEFPVEEEHQEEAMMFPVYAISIFYAIFLILLAMPMKLLFPGQPVILALLGATTLYYGGYEFWHAILHLPFERFWKPRMESPRMGKMFRHVYGFHLMHHWRPSSNLAVFGFWGIAVWDHAFRTHHRPERLPLAGAGVSYDDARLKKPLWPIAMMDSWQASFYRGSRKLEKTLARVFLGRRN